MLVIIDDFQIVSNASFHCKYKKKISRNFVIRKMRLRPKCPDNMHSCQETNLGLENCLLPPKIVHFFS